MIVLFSMLGTLWGPGVLPWLPGSGAGELSWLSGRLGEGRGEGGLWDSQQVTPCPCWMRKL